MSGFHSLTIAGVRQEIGGAARTVAFSVPPALQQTFSWRPGQHLTLRFTLDGGEVRRSYSISSSPHAGEPLRITVKRIRDGLVSGHINDTIAAGQQVEVMPPFGGFLLDPDPERRRTCYLIGAGSGITPLFAMLHSILVAEPWSVVHLLYGNRDAASVLFADELDGLLAEYPDRLTVSHVLSRPSLWSGYRYWRKGRIDAGLAGAWIEEHPPYAQDAQYFICGPGEMNASVHASLTGLDVPPGRIHRESYGGSTVLDDTVEGVAATAAITFEGRRHRVPVAKGETVLAAARSAGLELPYSCESGLCGACRCQLTDGSVHMRACMALTDEEVNDGAILACQSIATSPELKIRY